MLRRSIGTEAPAPVRKTTFAWGIVSGGLIWYAFYVGWLIRTDGDRWSVRQNRQLTGSMSSVNDACEARLRCSCMWRN